MLKKKEPVTPITLINPVINNVITPLGLPPEEQDFVAGEIKWLFSAVHNLQQVYQLVRQRLADEENKIKEQLRKELAGLHELQKKRLKERMTPLISRAWQEEIERSQPVAVPIPPEAQQQSQADNKLLHTINLFLLEEVWPVRIETGLNQINLRLSSLKLVLDRETLQGASGKENVALQNEIKVVRLEIVRSLQELAQLMNDAYGIKVTSPDQLAELMSQQ